MLEARISNPPARQQMLLQYLQPENCTIGNRYRDFEIGDRDRDCFLAGDRDPGSYIYLDDWD